MPYDAHLSAGDSLGRAQPRRTAIEGENSVATSGHGLAQKARIAWIDYAKGIGIFLVVLGHALRGLSSAGIMAETPLTRGVDLFIYSFHMPLFFLLSGLFLTRQLQRSGRSFLLDKVGTLIYPYFVWSTLQWLMQVAAGRYTNRTYSLADIWQIIYVPVMQFWFIYALFLILLLYLALAKAGLRPWAIFGVFAVWGLAGDRLHLIEWTPLLHAQAYGAYVALGAALYSAPRIARLPDRIPAGVAALISLAGYGLIGFTVIAGFQYSLLTSIMVAFCGIVASITLAALIARSGVFRAVEQWGKLSLEIYVAHTIASAALRILLSKVLKLDDTMIHIIIGTLGGIYLPIGLALVASRFGADYIYRLRFSERTERRGTNLSPVSESSVGARVPD